jgi:hypothetical protein
MACPQLPSVLLANEQHTTQCYPRQPVRCHCCVKLAQSDVAEKGAILIARAQLVTVAPIRGARSVGVYQHFVYLEVSSALLYGGCSSTRLSLVLRRCSSVVVREVRLVAQCLLDTVLVGGRDPNHVPGP